MPRRLLLLGVVVGLMLAPSSPSPARTNRAHAAPTATPLYGTAKLVASFSPADGSASELEAGDLNGDGLPDIVVTRFTYPPAHITHDVGILLANGHGGFTNGSTMWDGPPARTEWARQILIADFNGDHRNDIFIADTGMDADPFPGHANELILSTPQGKLVDASANLPPESAYSHSAAAADVNGDGTLDIFVGNFGGGLTNTPNEILLNDGTGHFVRRLDLLPAHETDPGGYTRSLFVDANGDGSPDLVLGAAGSPVSRVILNDGTGHFREPPTPLPPKSFGISGNVVSLAALDVNRDGRSDLIVGSTPASPFYVGRQLQVLIANGDGTFRDETAERLPQQDSGDGWPYAIRVADFNGDGLPDFTVSVVHFPYENTPLYLNDGNGVFHPVPFGSEAGLFTIVDANADGHPDVFSTVLGGDGSPERHYVQLEIVAPPAPSHLHAVATPKSIRLTWAPVAGATSYQVWRWIGAGTHVNLGLASLGRPYFDRSAKRHLAYTYAVRARNDAGVGPFSTPVTVRRR